MKLSELPQDIQDQLKEERKQLYIKWRRNTSHEVCFTDKEGTRYFYASRKLDNPTPGMGCYGSSTWYIRYGKILWGTRELGWGFDPIYEWRCTGQIFGKSANGTEIPRWVKSKKEVMAIIKAIGTLEIGE